MEKLPEKPSGMGLGQLVQAHGPDCAKASSGAKASSKRILDVRFWILDWGAGIGDWGAGIGAAAALSQHPRCQLPIENRKS